MDKIVARIQLRVNGDTVWFVVCVVSFLQPCRGLQNTISFVPSFFIALPNLDLSLHASSADSLKLPFVIKYWSLVLHPEFPSRDTLAHRDHHSRLQCQVVY